MSVNKNILQTKSVISKYELFGIIALFLIVLILFYPKGRLEKLIYLETKNYDLSIKYLEALHKAYPEEKIFPIALLRLYLKAGKLKEAKGLLKKLERTKKFSNSVKFAEIGYLVYKNLYFNHKDKKYLTKAKNYLIKLASMHPAKNRYEFIFKESRSMNFLDLEYKALKELVKTNPNKEYLKEFLNLSLYYKDFKAALSIIDYLYAEEKNMKYLEEKAKIYEYTKKPIKAKEIYLYLFKTTKDKELKTKYFLRAIYILAWNKKYNEAAWLAKKYENYFIKTKNISALKKLIKIYLQTNNAYLARRLSLKVLRVLDR